MTDGGGGVNELRRRSTRRSVRQFASGGTFDNSRPSAGDTIAPPPLPPTRTCLSRTRKLLVTLSSAQKIRFSLVGPNTKRQFFTIYYLASVWGAAGEGVKMETYARLREHRKMRLFIVVVIGTARENRVQLGRVEINFFISYAFETVTLIT